MYRIDIHNYTDLTMGCGEKWEEGKVYYNTIEEAEANHKIKKNYVSNGSYKVIARTMDEESFTVTDTMVKYFEFTPRLSGVNFMLNKFCVNPI